MWLSDSTIRSLVLDGALVIDPFDCDLVQPASIDCRLGRELKLMLPGEDPLDPIEPSASHWETTSLEDGDSFPLSPGDFVLGHTVERWEVPADIVGFVDGKSSLGRIGLLVHATAGLVDPGFRGQLTLELSNVGSRDILLRPGMKVAQLSFAFLDRCAERPYGSEGLGSHYQSQLGATVAR